MRTSKNPLKRKPDFAEFFLCALRWIRAERATPGLNRASRLSLSANGVRLLGFERGYAEVNAEQYTSG
jgi:hypothetical protein